MDKGRVENLKPTTMLTVEEQREFARKGGKASVEARRKKKAMREQALLLLDLPIKDKDAQKVLKSLGIGSTDMTNQMAIILGQFTKAIKGDTQSAVFLRDITDQKPVERIITADVSIETIQELDDLLDD